MPFFRPNGFKIFHTCIPCIKQNEFWIKTTFFGFVKHIEEMVILCFVVFIYVINPKIERYNCCTVCPNQGNQTYPLYSTMMFSTPHTTNKSHFFCVWFIQVESSTMRKPSSGLT